MLKTAIKKQDEGDYLKNLVIMAMSDSREQKLWFLF